MAGRGRGRTVLSFNVDSLGFGRGEALPSSAQKPSPLYPPMQFRPVPLQTGEEVEYMLALKQELRASSKNLPFHIQPPSTKKDVVRYSDKYQNGHTKPHEWSPDWSRFPKELSVRVQKPRKAKNKAAAKSKSKSKGDAPTELLQKLETLEKNEVENQSDEEGEGEGEKKKAADEEEEEPEDAEAYDEEEFEEGTDYIMSYFDNGEDFGGDSDDNMDEATY